VKIPAVAGDVVPNDGQPRVKIPAVAGDVVPNDGQPRVKIPAVAGDVVPNDGQPRVKIPAVAGDVVPNDGQPRVKNSAVAGEVVPNDGQPRQPGQTPAISPFVGEIAVGITLLVTYAPQIIALAAAVATIAAAVSLIKNQGTQSFELVKSIGSKLQRMLQLLLGPLSVSNGMAKEGVEDLSAHLLKVTQFVTKSISTPVSEVQGQVNQSLAMSRDLQTLLTRGRSLSEQMKGMTTQTAAELGKVVQGGEVQMFRDGSKNVANRLGKQADVSYGAFNQSLLNTQSSISGLEQLKKQIDRAVETSGKPASDATLQELGLSGADIGKQLIDARKNMVFSDKALTAADKSCGNLHTELLSLLGEMKTELTAYAKSNGISQEELDRRSKSSNVLGAFSPTGLSTRERGKSEKGSGLLTGEINFMVEELSKINSGTMIQLKKMESEKSQNRIQPSKGNVPTGDAKYQKMVSSYKKYLSIMSSDPANQHAIAAAKVGFEAAQADYQKAFEH